MILQHYLKKHKLTIAEFSKIANYTPQYISNIMRNTQKPGMKFKRWVHQITDGEVTVNEWPAKKIVVNDEVGV